MSQDFITIEIPDHAAPPPEDPHHRRMRKIKDYLNIIIRVILIVILIFVVIIPKWSTIQQSARTLYDGGKTMVGKIFPSSIPEEPLEEHYEYLQFVPIGDYVCGSTVFSLMWDSNQINTRIELTCDGNDAIVLTGVEDKINPIEYQPSARISTDESHALTSAEGVCTIEGEYSYCRYWWGYVFELVSVLESAHTLALQESYTPAPISVTEWIQKDCKLDHYISRGDIGTESMTIHGEYTAEGIFTIYAQADTEFTIELVYDAHAADYRIVGESGQILNEGSLTSDFRGDSLIAHLSTGEYIFIYIPWADGYPNYIVYSIAPTLEGGGC